MNDKDQLPFHQMLHQHRTRLGMTQRQLAELSTLSVRGIRDLESGRARRPRGTTVQLLADSLRLHGQRRVAFEAAAEGVERESSATGWALSAT